MSVVFALLSSLCYGVADFIGGAVSSRISAWTAAFCSQVGAVITAVVIASATAGQVLTGSLAWGALSGLGTALGLVTLYHGLSVGRMGVVAPITGVTGALIPAAAGLISGDRPSTTVWVGLLLALPAVALVAATPKSATEARSSGAIFGFLAGASFGVGYTAIAQIDEAAGHWPVAMAFCVGLIVTALIATLSKEQWIPRQPIAIVPVLGGVLSASAVVFFVEATSRGLLSVSSVLSALYPAVTVLLAVIILRERIFRIQGVGLLLTGAAITLVAMG